METMTEQSAIDELLSLQTWLNQRLHEARASVGTAKYDNVMYMRAGRVTVYEAICGRVSQALERLGEW